MIDLGKYSVLGVGIDAVDYQAAVDRIIAAAESRKPYAVSALAVHGVMTGVQDPVHRSRLNRLQLVTPDGQPVRWALRWLHGVQLPDRVYGPTLMLEVCAAAADAGISVFLYGSQEATLKALRLSLERRFPSLVVAGTRPSLFRRTTSEEKAEIVADIKDSGAGITFVGLGCPRQEVFAFEYRDELSMPVLAVGAAFDYHAGLLRPPPRWMQDRGLQWLFRLFQDPARLWHRYLVLNPLYMALCVGQKLRVWRPADLEVSESGSLEELRYG